MRTAVIGADGQLGTEVCEVFRAAGHEVLPLTEREVDVTERATLYDPLRGQTPEIIVNTAALTDVPRCEREPDLAHAVNTKGARNVALVACDIGAYLIHISTDYVFPGDKGAPYVEDDLPDPLSVYGTTKLAGERLVAAEAPNAAVVRTCGLYGKTPSVGKGGNFVETMLRLARERDEVRVVDDETVSPTSALDFARQILRLAHSPLAGIIHAAAHGACTWFEFAAEVFRLAGVTTALQRACPGEFKSVVRRPPYSVLENRVLARHGLDVLMGWQEELAEYIAARPPR